MRYVYDLYLQSVNVDAPAFRKATSTKLSDIQQEMLAPNPELTSYTWWIDVYDSLKDRKSVTLRSQDDIEMWEETLTRNDAWKPFDEKETGIQISITGIPKDAINPSHYKNYILDLQWLEAMQYIPTMSDSKCFKAAVELQVRKYLDRLGGKDAELQELEKALWYLKFLVAYVKNGNSPIRIADIEEILSGKRD